MVLRCQRTLLLLASGHGTFQVECDDGEETSPVSQTLNRQLGMRHDDDDDGRSSFWLLGSVFFEGATQHLLTQLWRHHYKSSLKFGQQYQFPSRTTSINSMKVFLERLTYLQCLKTAIGQRVSVASPLSLFSTASTFVPVICGLNTGPFRASPFMPLQNF